MFRYILIFVFFWGHKVLTENYSKNHSDVEMSVTLKMFNRQNSNGIEFEGNLSLVNSDKLVIFISHGWYGSSKKPWYGILTGALLKKYDCTVIQTDWAFLAAMEYPISVENTKIVGSKIGKTIQRLNKEQEIPLDKFWVIGHSLGAHVAGFAGKKVIELLDTKIPKIIGLDAAGPLFEIPEEVSQNQRLCYEDAKTVVNIHTDGGFLGYKNPIGTIDIFANGGSRIQPGCENTDSFEWPNLEEPLNLTTCSHGKSHEYYIRALNGEEIILRKCGSEDAYKNGECEDNKKLSLDANFDENDHGNYYFVTNS